MPIGIQAPSRFWRLLGSQGAPHQGYLVLDFPLASGGLCPFPGVRESGMGQEAASTACPALPPPPSPTVSVELDRDGDGRFDSFQPLPPTEIPLVSRTVVVQ